MSQPIDIVQRSLPEPELLALDAVEQIKRDIVFRVRSRGTPRCPSCSGSEVSYHSTYVRRLRDLPWQGQPVQVQVKTRRLRCRNRHCPRKIFCGATFKSSKLPEERRTFSLMWNAIDCQRSGPRP